MPHMIPLLKYRHKVKDVNNRAKSNSSRLDRARLKLDSSFYYDVRAWLISKLIRLWIAWARLVNNSFIMFNEFGSSTFLSSLNKLALESLNKLVFERMVRIQGYEYPFIVFRKLINVRQCSNPTKVVKITNQELELLNRFVSRIFISSSSARIFCRARVRFENLNKKFQTRFLLNLILNSSWAA